MVSAGPFARAELRGAGGEGWGGSPAELGVGGCTIMAVIAVIDTEEEDPRRFAPLLMSEEDEEEEEACGEYAENSAAGSDDAYGCGGEDDSLARAAATMRAPDLVGDVLLLLGAAEDSECWDLYRSWIARGASAVGPWPPLPPPPAPTPPAAYVGRRRCGGATAAAAAGAGTEAGSGTSGRVEVHFDEAREVTAAGRVRVATAPAGTVAAAAAEVVEGTAMVVVGGTSTEPKSSTVVRLQRLRADATPIDAREEAPMHRAGELDCGPLPAAADGDDEALSSAASSMSFVSSSGCGCGCGCLFVFAEVRLVAAAVVDDAAARLSLLGAALSAASSPTVTRLALRPRFVTRSLGCTTGAASDSSSDS